MSSSRRPSKLGTASLIRTLRARVPSVASTTVAASHQQERPAEVGRAAADQQHGDQAGGHQAQRRVGVDAPTQDLPERPRRPTLARRPSSCDASAPVA